MSKQNEYNVDSTQSTAIESEYEEIGKTDVTQEEAEQLANDLFAWKKAYFKQHPVKGTLIAMFLVTRLFYGLFFFFAFYQKFTKKWATTKVMQGHFKKRYSELKPNSFSARYLKYFGIPFYRPIAVFLVCGQLMIALGMITGTATRFNGRVSLFMLLNIGAGGYGNITLPPFIIDAALLSVLPSGQWFGLDKKLHQKYPNSFLFK